MAIMYPSSIESYNYTESEKFVYDKLENELSDEYHVFYSIRWYTKVRDKKEESECDFLVFHPRYGYLCIEVKGGVEIQIEDNIWKILDSHDSEEYRVLKRSPFKQAELSMYYFKKYYEEQFAGEYAGVYGLAVATPFYNIECDMGVSYPKFLIIDKKAFDNLEKRIREIFAYWRNRDNNILPLTLNQQKKFIAMLNKRIALSAAAGALIELRRQELDKINKVQDAYINFIQNYNQVFIIGGAGTGKTWIGIKKAIQDCKKDKKVLIVTLSELLCKYIALQLKGYDIDCLSYSELCKQNNECVYSTIIVDEAQDFDEKMATTIRSRLADEELSSLYVMYDNNQRLYEVSFKDKFKIHYPEFILRDNIRNTSEIYNWCVQETRLGMEVNPSLIQGVRPEVSTFRDDMAAVKKVEELINTLVRRECVKTKSITILSNRAFEYSILSKYEQLSGYNIVRDTLNVNENEIFFEVEKRYKGLEADVIIYINHMDDGRDFRKEYVAYTRARFYLYVINVL